MADASNRDVWRIVTTNEKLPEVDAFAVPTTAYVLAGLASSNVTVLAGVAVPVSLAVLPLATAAGPASVVPGLTVKVAVGFDGTAPERPARSVATTETP